MRATKTGRRSEVDMVAAVQERTRQAAALAQISGQELLTDPRLNPETRGHADALRTDQQVKALDAEHARLLRRHRVADRRAAEAERTLEAIALARRASSPARSVMALHAGRRLYARLAVAASVALATGSAMGVEAAAHVLDAPTGTGYLSELGLTGLSTAAITYRAHLAEHRGVLVKGSWQSRSLWALMIVPLLVSITANAATANALGAACALGAAAFALLGAVVADRSAAAMQARAAEVDAADEAELHATAMGEDSLFTAVADPDHARQDEGLGDVDAGVDAGAALMAPLTLGWNWDNSPEIAESWDDAGGTGHIVEPSDLDADEDEVAGGQIVLDQADQDEDQDGAGDAAEIVPDELRRVRAAAEARRAAGEQTRTRVAGFLTRHPDATISQIADGLQISDATAKRHRRALREANGVEL